MKKPRPKKGQNAIPPPAPDTEPDVPAVPEAPATPTVTEPAPAPGPMDVEFPLSELGLTPEERGLAKEYEAFYSPQPPSAPALPEEPAEALADASSLVDPVPPPPAPVQDPAPKGRAPQEWVRGVYVGKLLETDDDVLEHSYPHLLKK